MKKITLTILLFFWASVFSVSLSEAFLQWPDTGQTTSYTDTFGEDSDYNHLSVRSAVSIILDRLSGE